MDVWDRILETLFFDNKHRGLGLLIFAFSFQLCLLIAKACNYITLNWLTVFIPLFVVVGLFLAWVITTFYCVLWKAVNKNTEKPKSEKFLEIRVFVEGLLTFVVLPILLIILYELNVI